VIARFALKDFDLAEQATRQGLKLCLETDDLWSGAAFLGVAAWIAAARADAHRVGVLMAASVAACRATGVSTTMAELVGRFHERCERYAREQLSSAEYGAAWAEGDSLPFTDAVALALR